jgi:DUF1009 family protein
MVVGNDRLAIIAGSGSLPLHVALAAKAAGENPFIIRLRDDCTVDWSGFDQEAISIGDVKRLKELTTRHSIGRVVLSGAVSKRPEWNEIHPTFKVFLQLPSIIKTLLSGGDDAVLQMVVKLLEGMGLKVLGAHEIAPDILVSTGALSALRPTKDDLVDIRAGIRAAYALGKLDIGQGGVSVGGRIIALEGAEGTDQMLERVASLREQRRISQRRKGVLVKLCKPQQDIRADLPTVGVSTVRNAQKAGLAGIAVESGRAFILNRDAMLEEANSLGLFVYGIDPSEIGEA